MLEVQKILKEWVADLSIYAGANWEATKLYIFYIFSHFLPPVDATSNKPVQPHLDFIKGWWF